MENMIENVFEFYKDDDRVSVTLSQGRFITKFKKLAEQYPDEMDYIINKDGSLFGHMPVSFLKLRGPNKLSDEQRHRLSKNWQDSPPTRK